MIWMQTLGRTRYMDLSNPLPSMVDLSTLGTVLARIPRFGGHTTGGIYSVAQHCEQGARAILRAGLGKEAAAAFLLHDAHEAYTGDISTPVEQVLGPEASSAIRRLKAKLDEAIYTAAGIAWPLPANTRQIVKTYDLRMMRTERDARLAPPPWSWAPVVEAMVPLEGVDTYPWSEGTTAKMWQSAFRELVEITEQQYEQWLSRICAVPIAAQSGSPW